jgi:LysM repeat protein
MLHMKKSVVRLAVLAILVAGCNLQGGPESLPTRAIDPPSNPYQSTTRTPVTVTPTTPPSTTVPIIPTPTPFMHTIQPGETLYGIAISYNISFDKLISANPGLDPRLLIVGTEVIIPLAEEEDLPPTPTPYPLLVETPSCYPTAEGGLYCIALLENDQGTSLENISLAFNILDSDQELVKSELGFPPLNTLFPGQTIPVGVLLTEVGTNQIQISTSLLTAYPAPIQDPQVEISDYSLEYSQENTIAQVMGTFEILDTEDIERQVWIAGVGYHQGKPVALRKWISGLDLIQANSYTFDFVLYSLGPEIDRVELLVELH